MIQRCAACGVDRHPPTEVCYACGSLDWSWEPHSGNGTVYSYTWVERPIHPGLAALGSYNTTVVELDDTNGVVRILTRITDLERDDARGGPPRGGPLRPGRRWSRSRFRPRIGSDARGGRRGSRPSSARVCELIVRPMASDDRPQRSRRGRRALASIAARGVENAPCARQRSAAARSRRLRATESRAPHLAGIVASQPIEVADRGDGPARRRDEAIVLVRLSIWLPTRGRVLSDLGAPVDDRGRSVSAQGRRSAGWSVRPTAPSALRRRSPTGCGDRRTRARRGRGRPGRRRSPEPGGRASSTAWR